MQPPSRTRSAVYTAADQCQSTREQVMLSDFLDGPSAVEAAFAEWCDDRGDDPKVKLMFRNGWAVLDYVDG
jgi:hypothetical protein